MSGRYIIVPITVLADFKQSYLAETGERYSESELNDTQVITHSRLVTPAHEATLKAQYPDVVFADEMPDG